MYKYVIATALTLGVATSAIAAEFYVGIDQATKQCRVTSQEPDGTVMKQVGTPYESMDEAQQAITTLPECS
ncbi:MAG: hypothetical protein ACRECX_06135 [Methyloceanibacter sp.]|uniref:hypothetical protein n=1 Tax=Methyloceanibacter sp. TaxID=1965321 RepID=UPI003D6CFD13